MPGTFDFAIDELRHMTGNFDQLSETFNQSFSLLDLVAIHRAWMASGWDIAPDMWTEEQVQDALCGIAPDWESDEVTPKVSALTSTIRGDRGVHLHGARQRLVEAIR